MVGDLKIIDSVVRNLLSVDHNLVKPLNKRPNEHVRRCYVLVAIPSMSRLQIAARDHEVNASSVNLLIGRTRSLQRRSGRSVPREWRRAARLPQNPRAGAVGRLALQ